MNVMIAVGFEVQYTSHVQKAELEISFPRA